MPDHTQPTHYSQSTVLSPEGSWREGRASDADEELPPYKRTCVRSPSNASRSSYLHEKSYGYGSQRPFEQGNPSSIPEIAETGYVSLEEQVIQARHPHPDPSTIPVSADEETVRVAASFEDVPLGVSTPAPMQSPGGQHGVQDQYAWMSTSSQGLATSTDRLEPPIRQSSLRPKVDMFENRPQRSLKALGVLCSIFSLLALLPLLAYSISLLGVLLSRMKSVPQQQPSPLLSPWAYAAPSLLWSSVGGVLFMLSVWWRVKHLKISMKKNTWAPFSVLTRGDKVGHCLLVGGLVVGVGALPDGLATLGSPEGVRALDGFVVNATGLGTGEASRSSAEPVIVASGVARVARRGVRLYLLQRVYIRTREIRLQKGYICIWTHITACSQGIARALFAAAAAVSGSSPAGLRYAASTSACKRQARIRVRTVSTPATVARMSSSLSTSGRTGAGGFPGTSSSFCAGPGSANACTVQ
ncbi:hypothetical protein C8Q80DRAFT_1343479 [Daedaleopsis nitida]|nr:hypothetical protein C8Q80DRAFT_1343479 [Daedaleopsis nitida]